MVVDVWPKMDWHTFDESLYFIQLKKLLLYKGCLVYWLIFLLIYRNGGGIILKTKIVYIVNSLGIGGSEKIVESLVNGIYKNFEISIFCLKAKNNHSKLISIHNSAKIYFFDDVIKINYNIWSYLQLAFFNFNYKANLKPILLILNEINPDIIHFHTHPKDIIIGRFYRKMKPSVKLIYTDHSSRYKAITLGFRHQLFLICIRLIYYYYSQIFISKNSQFNAERLKLINNKLVNRTINNTINISLFNKHIEGKQEGRSRPLKVVYVSRVVEKKGHKDLLKAISLLKQYDLELLIVGDGNLLSEMKGLCEELEITDKVKFTGAVINVKKILEESDIGVFPSYQEGLPLSLLEKMAMSLPVIVSDIPELTSIITHNENGLVYKKGNQKDLKEKLQYLLLNKNVRVRIGANARIYVEKYHNQDNYVQGHLAFYHEILETKKISHA